MNSKLFQLQPHLSAAILFVISAGIATAGWYAPEPGQPGSTAISKDSPVFVNWANGHSAYSPGAAVDAVWQTPAKAEGKAEGDIFGIACLGNGGSITMVFPNPICDGTGADFAVFENSFRNKAFAKIPFNGMFMCDKKRSTHEEIAIGEESDTGMRGRVGRPFGETRGVAGEAPGDGGGHAGIAGW